MQRDADDDGFTLVEVLVALSIITLVMASMGTFFVRSVSTSHHYAVRDDAVRLAGSALERVRGIRPAQLLSGRGQAAVAAEPAPAAVTAYLSNSVQVWDTTVAAASGATATLPTSPVTIVLNKINYSEFWYVVRCWLTPSAGGACAAANKSLAGAAGFLRVVVAVQWPDSQCAGATCTYVAETLVSDAADPVFPIPTTATPSPSPSAGPSPSPSPSATAGSGVAAIWVNHTSGFVNPAALWLSSANLTVTGLVHSNSDLNIGGSGLVLSPTIEYVTSQYISGGTMPTPTQVAAGSPAGVRQISSYAPGGSAATAAGSGYYAVSAAACASGTWTLAAGAVPATATATVIYVPCNVTVTTSFTPLLVATGTIMSSQSSITVGSAANPRAGGMLSGSAATPAIQIAGSATTVYGTIQALNGGVYLLGSYGNFVCGIIGDTAQIRGSDIAITTGSQC